MVYGENTTTFYNIRKENKMNIIERMDLKKKIAAALNKQLDVRGVTDFFRELGISVPSRKPRAGTVSYANDILMNIKPQYLKKIAKELGINTSSTINIDEQAVPTHPSQSLSPVKGFISHTSEHQDVAKIMSDSLKKFNIELFVAHKSIKPTQEWQQVILKELKAMEFLISFHTMNFAESVWSQQEVGFAVAKEVLVIPFKVNANPVGFINKYQALATTTTLDKDIKNILDILKLDPKIAPRINF